MADYEIKCNKSGKVLPGALVNNFSAEFSYDGGGNKQTYRGTFAPQHLRELETQIAALLDRFLNGPEEPEEPEELEGDPSE